MSSSTASQEVTSPKSAITALLLCMFLGMFGAHRFYVGKIGTGILMLLTAGGLGIWTFVDMIYIACCEFKDKEGRVLIFKRGDASPGKLVFLILGIGFLVLIVYASLVFTVVYYATKGVGDTVRSEITALRAGDLDKAYSYTSKEFQHTTSLEDFKKFVQSTHTLNSIENTSLTDIQISNNEGYVKESITSKDGSTVPVEFNLIYENGAWKILNINIQSAGVNSNDSKPNDQQLNEDTGDKSNNEASQDKTAPQEITHNIYQGSTNNSLSLPVALSNQYENKLFQYRIKYPINWEYENSKTTSEVIFSGKKGESSYYSTVIVQVVKMKKTSGGKYENTKEIISDIKEQLSSETINAQMLDEGLAELPQNTSLKGNYLVATYNYKGTDYKKMIYVIERNSQDISYVFNYTAPSEQYKLYLPIIKSMYQSWIIY